MNMIAEPCEVFRRARENAVVEMDGEIVVVTSEFDESGQDAEESVTLKEACNPRKSECLSTGKTTQNIPDTPPGNRVKLKSRPGKPGPATSKDSIRSNKRRQSKSA